MIPKVIHYCWFGRKALPESARRCIESWRRFFPDYEIRQWNEDNFDVNAIRYTREAYEAQKYAFVSDYARFKILYEHGGIYFDTDVEVIKPFDDILVQGPFMGLETNPVFKDGEGSLGQQIVSSGSINPGLGLAATPGLGIYKAILDKYDALRFKGADGALCLTTVVQYVTSVFIDKGLEVKPGIMEFSGVRIYPIDYFNPKRFDGRIVTTPNTHSIHHYTASWYSTKQRIVMWIIKHIGLWPGRAVSLLWNNPLKIAPRIIRFMQVGK